MRNPQPTEDEIRHALDGNPALHGYQHIVDGPVCGKANEQEGKRQEAIGEVSSLKGKHTSRSWRLARSNQTNNRAKAQNAKARTEKEMPVSKLVGAR
jgi:hypothetical protein